MHRRRARPGPLKTSSTLSPGAGSLSRASPSEEHAAAPAAQRFCGPGASNSTSRPDEAGRHHRCWIQPARSTFASACGLGSVHHWSQLLVASPRLESRVGRHSMWQWPLVGLVCREAQRDSGRLPPRGEAELDASHNLRCQRRGVDYSLQKPTAKRRGERQIHWIGFFIFISRCY